MRSQPRTFIWAISDYFLPSPLTFLSTGNLCIHVQMGKLDHKEGWVPKNRCFCVLVLQKTRRVPWTERRSNQSILQEINPKYSSEGQLLNWSSNTLATWSKQPTCQKKTPWCWEGLKAKEKRVAEDEMFQWRYWLIEHEFEQTLGDGEGKRSLACCSPWGHKELDMTWQLNNTNLSKWTSGQA